MAFLMWPVSGPRSRTWAAAFSPPPQKSGAAAFLQDVFGYSPREVENAWKGTPAVRRLDSDDSREIGAVGLVGVPITPEEYLERLSDIERFKRAEAVRQIGRFGDPPRHADVQDLTPDDADVRDLRSCRLHDCDLQLPASTIRQAERDDWRGGDSRQRAGRLLQDLLLDRARAYAQGDTRVPMMYAHRRRAVSVADEFRSLVEDDRYALARLPSLRGRLLRPGLDAGDFLYWSREKVARNVVLSLTHVVIDRPRHDAVAYAIGSKQLYASHYFYASLGLTLLLPDESRPGTTLVLYMNRSRVDAFEGWFGGIARRLVRSRVSSAMRDHLAQLRRRLESRPA